MFSSFTQHSYSASNSEHSSSRAVEKTDRHDKGKGHKSEHRRRVPHRSLSMPGTHPNSVVSTELEWYRVMLPLVLIFYNQ